ncbi:Cytochrome c biogenesis protein TlpA [Hydrogenophaga sp. T4]|nr:Cytochrome c biogenesis protein TlpA [Hydrogenophaga sp. T4]
MLSDAEAEFWASRFEDPDGQPLALERFRGQPLLVNFWATWCPPCVEELPMLNAFYREHQARGWQVVGLAVDQLPAVRSFLQKLPLAFPVGMVGFAGTELSRVLGNPGGGLPTPSCSIDRAWCCIKKWAKSARPIWICGRNWLDRWRGTGILPLQKTGTHAVGHDGSNLAKKGIKSHKLPRNGRFFSLFMVSCACVP